MNTQYETFIELANYLKWLEIFLCKNLIQVTNKNVGIIYFTHFKLLADNLRILYLN